jgi:hypothetical protein
MSGANTGKPTCGEAGGLSTNTVVDTAELYHTKRGGPRNKVVRVPYLAAHTQIRLTRASRNDTGPSVFL